LILFSLFFFIFSLIISLFNLFFPFRLESKLNGLKLKLSETNEELDCQRIFLEKKSQKAKELESSLQESLKANKKLEKELKNLEKKLKLLEFQRSLPTPSTPLTTSSTVTSVTAAPPSLVPPAQSQPQTTVTPTKELRDASGESTPSITRVRTYSGAEAAAKFLALSVSATPSMKAKAELEIDSDTEKEKEKLKVSDVDKDKEKEIQTEPSPSLINEAIHSKSMDATVEVEEPELAPLTDRVVLTMEVSMI
jgi:predicted transcriptional regulator